MAVERVHVRNERITVLPPIAGGLRAPLDPRDTSNRLDGLNLHRAEFAVYPANFWPHKNHERLLSATARIVREEPRFLLVLCGALDENREEVRGRVVSLRLEPNVRLLPYLEDADVTALLEGAEFLVFPSLFEGFGLPVLEAMALGTPVACSDLPALIEVAGDASLFFDADDEAGLASTMLRLWREEETRDRLVRKGRARATVYEGIDVAGAYHELLCSMGE
jgi:glycosyltransferase involved in cell wall biosynthesis